MKHVVTDPLRDPSPQSRFDLPPPSVSPNNFCLDCPKSLLFPPIVLLQWDLPCCRKWENISDERFRHPISYVRVFILKIARRQLQCEGPNVLGRQVASRNGTHKSQKDGCNKTTSKEVTNPITTLAQARLTVVFLWDLVH